MISITSLKSSSTQHDVHFVNLGPIYSKTAIKAGYAFGFGYTGQVTVISNPIKIFSSAPPSRPNMIISYWIKPQDGDAHNVKMRLEIRETNSGDCLPPVQERWVLNVQGWWRLSTNQEFPCHSHPAPPGDGHQNGCPQTNGWLHGSSSLVWASRLTRYTVTWIIFSPPNTFQTLTCCNLLCILV